MKISTKTDYALRAMLELALEYGKGSLSIQEIARRQNIPKRYLEHLLLLLKKNGMLNSYRGKEGGYSLARHPREIKLSEVFQAMEVLDLFPRKNKRRTKDVVDEVWEKVQETIIKSLDSTTLEDLAIKKRAAEKALIYQI